MHAVAPRPLSDSAAGKPVSVKLVRAYEAWEGNNKFLFQGRFILGPDWRSVPITIFLIVAPVVVFCVFVARKLMDDFSHHLGILIMVSTVIFTLYDLLLLLMISVRDPGIVPRSAHAPEPEYYLDPETGSRRAGRFARVKEVVVNGTVVKSKYCDTCLCYRPPRCSHCSICDNCIERFDHHCPWVGQCIGKRNYRFFFMFVSSSTLLCIYVFSFCWVYIIRIMHSERTSVWKAMIRTPASMALIIYAFLAVWFVGGLTVFHLYLIFTNQTTYESYRNRKANGNVPRPHPYNRGIRHNLKEVFCSAIPPSGNNFRAMVVKEAEISLQGGVGGRFSGIDSGKALSDVENKRRVLLEDLAFINGDDIENQASNGGSSPEKDIEPAVVDMRINLPSEEVAELDQDTQPSRKSSWRKRSGNEDVPSDNLVSDPPARDGEELVRYIPSDASLAPDLSENLPTEEGSEVVGDDSSDPSRRSVEVDKLSEAVDAASEVGSSSRFTKQQAVADSSSLKV